MKKLFLFIAILSGIASAQVVSIAKFGEVFTDSVQFTRPANATQYAAGDIVRDNATDRKFLPITAGRQTNGSSGYIISASLVTDTANVATGTFSLLLFRDTTGMGATLPADNAAYTFNIAAHDKHFVGLINFTLSAYGLLHSRAFASDLRVPFDLRSTSTKKLWGVLIATGAYTPAHGGKIIIRLTSQQN